MQYEVSNIGDRDYTTNLNDLPIIFGGYTDVNPAGSGATDDAAGFDKEYDIVYGWSSTGQGNLDAISRYCLAMLDGNF